MVVNMYGYLFFMFLYVLMIRMRLVNRVKFIIIEVIICMMRKKLLIIGRKMLFKLKKIEICMLCGNLIVCVSGIIIK